MNKLEKVIKAWECCNPLNRRCFECPYDADCFHDSFDRVAIADMVKLLKECDTVEYALSVLRKHGWKETDDVPYPVELLKEQQPKKPVYDCPLIRCPRCKNSINIIQKYCDECGQAIDWSKDGEQE